MEQSSGIPKTGITAVVIIVAALWTGLALVAAEAQGQGQGPCADDAAKFCKDVQPGGGRIMKCMKEHVNDLSPACKKQVAELKKGVREFSEVCQDDALKFCKDIKPGGGRMVKCLKDHENELSPECRARMERGRMRNK